MTNDSTLELGALSNDRCTIWGLDSTRLRCEVKSELPRLVAWSDGGRDLRASGTPGSRRPLVVETGDRPLGTSRPVAQEIDDAESIRRQKI